MSVEPSTWPGRLGYRVGDGFLSRERKGNFVWGTSAAVDDAGALRLELAEVNLPEGTRFWVYSMGGEGALLRPSPAARRRDDRLSGHRGRSHLSRSRAAGGSPDGRPGIHHPAAARDRPVRGRSRTAVDRRPTIVCRMASVTTAAISRASRSPAPVRSSMSTPQAGPTSARPRCSMTPTRRRSNRGY